SVVFLGIPERAVVYRINGEIAVIAPAVGSAGLTARSVKQVCFALRELVEWIAHQPPRVANLRIDAGRRCAKTKCQIATAVHGSTPHPAPGGIGLVGALLEDCHGSRGHIAQFEPAYTCYPA